MMFDVGGLDNILKRLKAGRGRLRINDDILSSRFDKNLKVLKEYFPTLYEDIKDYEPKNKNIFLEEDGALNVFFPDLGACIYPEDAFFNIDKRFKEFALKPERTFLNVEGDIGHSRHEYYLYQANKLRKKAQQKHIKNKALPSVMGGLIMFGFELGYQLIRILDEHYSKHIYIYEKDIDLFYYSLFSIDWEWLTDKMIADNMTLHFFIGMDEREFVNQYVSSIRYNGIYMCSHTYLYLSYQPKYLDDIASEFSNQYARQIMGWGFFDDGVIGIGQYLARNRPTYLILDPEEKEEIHFKKGLDLPVMILGNGPSLDENIDFIRDNVDNFILISCGTTLNTLYKYGIKPDFHADLERLKHTSEKLNFIDKEYLEGVTALTVNVMHPEFYEYFEKCIIGMRPGEPISSIMKYGNLVSPEAQKRLSFMEYCGPVVANLAMSYVHKMGFSNVYMVGVDCGFIDPEIHHSKKSGYYNDDGTNTGLAIFNKGLKPRAANFGGIAYTTAIMDTSRVYLELCIESIKKKNPLFKCYNLSNGVRISGADPIRSDDVLASNVGFSSKDKVEDYIFRTFVFEEKDCYGSRDVGDIYDEFNEFSESVVKLLRTEFSTSVELLDLLSECNSLVMKQNYIGKRYNYELFSGSFIYFANEIVNLVLSTPDDVLNTAREILDIFIEFVQEMPAMLKDPMASVDPGRGLLDGKYNA